MGGTVSVKLPTASPELYLKSVEWIREANDYATSAAFPGRIPKKRRGADPVHDLLLYEAPEQVERAARQAIAEGRTEVAPVLEVDPELLRQARERGEAIWL